MEDLSNGSMNEESLYFNTSYLGNDDNTNEDIINDKPISQDNFTESCLNPQNQNEKNEEETKEKSDPKKDNKENMKFQISNDVKKNESIKQSNSKEIKNGLNPSKNGKITKLGRKRKYCEREGKYNKFSSDNMIKKSFNSSLKFSIKKFNESFKKIKENCEEFIANIKKDEIFLQITTEFSKDYSKKKVEEMMKKNFETIFIESKISENYRNYHKKGKNKNNKSTDNYKDYNKKSISWIHDMYEKKGNKDFEKYVIFLKTAYGDFWKHVKKYKNNNPNIISNPKVFNIEKKKNDNKIDDNNDFLDEVVQDYINKTYSKKEEEEYKNKFKDLQMNMCEILNYN